MQPWQDAGAPDPRTIIQNGPAAMVLAERDAQQYDRTQPT